MNKNFNNSIDQSIVGFTNQLDTIQQINILVDKHYRTNFNSLEDKDYLDQLNFMLSLSDVSSLITIANLDLSVIIKYLCNPYNTLNNWEKVFFTKNVYLTIFETLKTFEKYRKFLYDVASINFPNLKQDFIKVNDLIKNFKNQFDYQGKISFIRNNVIAHINKNVELYYDTIQTFDENETVEMIDKFFLIAHDLHNFLINILMQDDVKKKMEYLKNLAEERIPDLKEKMSLGRQEKNKPMP